MFSLANRRELIQCLKKQCVIFMTLVLLNFFENRDSFEVTKCLQSYLNKHLQQASNFNNSYLTMN